VFILTILQIVSMIDRQVISVLIPDIGADLGEGAITTALISPAFFLQRQVRPMLPCGIGKES